MQAKEAKAQNEKSENEMYNQMSDEHSKLLEIREKEKLDQVKQKI